MSQTGGQRCKEGKMGRKESGDRKDEEEKGQRQELWRLGRTQESRDRRQERKVSTTIALNSEERIRNHFLIRDIGYVGKHGLEWEYSREGTWGVHSQPGSILSTSGDLPQALYRSWSQHCAWLYVVPNTKNKFKIIKDSKDRNTGTWILQFSGAEF